MNNRGFPKGATYNTKIEHHIVSEINRLVIDYDILTERSKTKYGIDIDVNEFDYSNNMITYRMCGVEVENKGETYQFTEYPDPPSDWSDWSFLSRKIDEEDNKDEDVYLLCDHNDYSKIFWITFGDIRKTCIRDDSKEIKDSYWRLKINTDTKDFMHRGYDTLFEYLLGLKESQKRIRYDNFDENF